MAKKWQNKVQKNGQNAHFSPLLSHRFNIVQQKKWQKNGKIMQRLFIKSSEMMLITGWGRTKTGDICRLIRFLYAYPPNRKDILLKDFCDYLGLNEAEVQEAVKII